MARKYRNQPVEIDGIRFDSKREAAHYAELKLLEKAGQIRDIIVHPSMVLVVNGMKICRFVPDFRFNDVDPNGHTIWPARYQDTKGVITRDWKLKAKLFHAIYGIEIEVIK